MQSTSGWGRDQNLALKFRGDDINKYETAPRNRKGYCFIYTGQTRNEKRSRKSDWECERLSWWIQKICRGAW